MIGKGIAAAAQKMAKKDRLQIRKRRTVIRERRNQHLDQIVADPDFEVRLARHMFLMLLSCKLKSRKSCLFSLIVYFLCVCI